MKIQTILICASVVASCASSKFDYTPPTPGLRIDNELIIQKPFGGIWDEFVSELSKSFFVINNISKESRIINVSFSTNRPSEFIDCGYTTLVSEHPARGRQVFRYKVADSNQHWIGIDGTNHIVSRERDVKLEGRINVYIAPHGVASTVVRVNARYIFEIKVIERGVTAHHYATQTGDLRFSSNETATGRDVVCRPTGRLEEQLLQLARNAARA